MWTAGWIDDLLRLDYTYIHASLDLDLAGSVLKDDLGLLYRSRVLAELRDAWN